MVWLVTYRVFLLAFVVRMTDKRSLSGYILNDGGGQRYPSALRLPRENRGPDNEVKSCWYYLMKRRDN